MASPQLYRRRGLCHLSDTTDPHRGMGNPWKGYLAVGKAKAFPMETYTSPNGQVYLSNGKVYSSQRDVMQDEEASTHAARTSYWLLISITHEIPVSLLPQSWEANQL